MVIRVSVYAVNLCGDKHLFKGEKTFEEFKKDFYKSLEEIVDHLNISKTIEYNGVKILVTKKISDCPDSDKKVNSVKQIIDHINNLLTKNMVKGTELVNKLVSTLSYRTEGDKEQLISKFLRTIIITPEFYSDECEEDNLTIMFYTPEIDMYDIIELNMIIIQHLRNSGFRVTYPAFDDLLPVCDIDIYDVQFETLLQKMREKGWEYIEVEDVLLIGEGENYVLKNGKWVIKGGAS